MDSCFGFQASACHACWATPVDSCLIAHSDDTHGRRYKAGSDWRVAGTATSPAGTIISICTGDYCDASTKSKTINGITPFRTTAGVAPAPADWSVSALSAIRHACDV